MAFQSSSVANLDTLLQTIVDFAVANAGFTEHTKVTVAGRPSDMYIIQRGSIYWYFVGQLNPVACTNYGDYGIIQARMMTVLPTAANKDTTSLGQQYATTVILYSRYDGPFQEYRLYSNPDGDSVHMALEVFPNIFTHMSFGNLNKFGTYTGGEYVTALTAYMNNVIYDVNLYDGFRVDRVWSATQGFYPTHGIGPNPTIAYAPGQVHLPNDPIDNTYSDFSPMTTSAILSRRAVPPSIRDIKLTPIEGLLGDFNIMGSNVFNSRAPLIPSYYQAYYAANFHSGNNRYPIIGSVNDVSVINMDRIEPKETVDGDWDVYPQTQKAGDGLVAPVSLTRGIAYKRYE